MNDSEPLITQLERALHAAKSNVNRDDRVALDAATQARELASRLGDWQTQGEAELLLGNCLARMGRLEESVEVLQQALQRFEQARDYQKAIQSHGQLGAAYGQIGQFDQALDHLEVALDLCEEHGLIELRRPVLNNMSIIWSILGSHNLAQRTLKEALENQQSPPNDLMAASMSINLAVLTLQSTRFSDELGAEADDRRRQVRDFLNYAHSVFERFGDPLGRLHALAQLNCTYVSEGNLAKINENLEVMSVLLQTAASPVVSALFTAQQAVVASLEGNFDKADALNQQALDLVVPDCPPDFVGSVYFTMARQHEREGRYKEAYEDLFQYARYDLLNQTRLADRLQQAFQQRLELGRVRRYASRDPLTGLLNRRGLQQAAQHLPPGQVGLIMVDIDHFKQINDDYGHVLGDSVLVELTQLLLELSHPRDVLSRLGGEEFVMLVVNTDHLSVMEFSEQLRRRVQEYDWSQLQAGLKVTVSCGWTIMDIPGDLAQRSALDLKQELLESVMKADRYLYHAKKTGRNRVVNLDGELNLQS